MKLKQILKGLLAGNKSDNFTDSTDNKKSKESIDDLNTLAYSEMKEDPYRITKVTHNTAVENLLKDTNRYSQITFKDGKLKGFVSLLNVRENNKTDLVFNGKILMKDSDMVSSDIRFVGSEPIYCHPETDGTKTIHINGKPVSKPFKKLINLHTDNSNRAALVEGKYGKELLINGKSITGLRDIDVNEIVCCSSSENKEYVGAILYQGTETYVISLTGDEVKILPLTKLSTPVMVQQGALRISNAGHWLASANTNDGICLANKDGKILNTKVREFEIGYKFSFSELIRTKLIPIGRWFEKTSIDNIPDRESMSDNRLKTYVTEGLLIVQEKMERCEYYVSNDLGETWKTINIEDTSSLMIDDKKYSSSIIKSLDKLF